jgi:formate dehydrogenase major subunit
MFKGFITEWPLLKQLRTRDWHGTGEVAMSERTKSLGPKVEQCQVSHSVCPYCGVGCGQLVYHKNGELVAIEGDPDSPVSRGRLCPKGADTFQLHTHAGRLTKVKYRRPGSRQWEELDLETALDMVAERVWDSRERTFVEEEDGGKVMHTLGVCHLGGATMDIEENYLIRKLFTGGLGMNCISNQARI